MIKKIRKHMKIIGTVTGRTSSTFPNFQNITRLAMTKRSHKLIPEVAVINNILLNIRTEDRMTPYGLAKRGVQMRRESVKLVKAVNKGLDRCKQHDYSPMPILGLFFNEDFWEISQWIMETTENEDLRLILIKAKMVGKGETL